MNKIQILKISLVSLFFIGALILLGYLGVFSNVLNLSQSASVRDAVKGKAVYNIHPSKIQPGVFTFDYVFDKNVKPPKGEALFDLPIIPFDEK